MHKIIPVRELKTHKIIHRKPSKLEVLRQQINFRRDGLSEFEHDDRTIAILLRKLENSWKEEEVIMSDSTMEQQSNKDIIRRAHGDVFIAGLGLGMILLPILQKPEVKSVTVVELYPDVIELVHPYIAENDSENKLTVIQDDILHMESIGIDTKYDVIYFDIWNTICTDNWEDIKMLKRKFRKLLNKEDPQNYIGAWMEDEIQYMQRRDR